MVSGKKQPFISQESVRKALESLLYTSVPRPTTALEELLLVKLILSDPDLPPVNLRKEFAVQHLLTSMIREAVEQHRRNLDLPPQQFPEPKDVAEAALAAAGREQNPELIGWSILYYRYVCVGLNLSLDAISQTMQMDERTLRRYQSHAIRRLTEKLTAVEWEARNRQRKLKLYAALPASRPMPMFGRAEAMQRVAQIKSQGTICHVHVTGVKGIGKTTFVQEVVRQSIDAEEIEHLVWLDHPTSARFLYQYLTETLLNAEAALTLREFVLSYSTAVVLDHVGPWVEQPDFRSLLADLSAANVFIISETYYHINSDVKHIPLQELRWEDTQKFLIASSTQALAPDEVRHIWETVGGNPAVLKTATQHLGRYDYELVDWNALSSVFEQTIERLPDQLKAVLLAFAMLPDRDIEVEHFQHLWPERDTYNEIIELIKLRLLDAGQQSGTCRLTYSVRRYLERLADDSMPVRQMLDALAHEIHLADSLEAAYDLVLHILVTGWVQPGEALERKWMSLLLDTGLKRGDYASWALLLENHFRKTAAFDLKLYIAFGVCLRNLAELEAAEQVLVEAVAECGAHGQFVTQGKALLELGILRRQHGRYEEAMEIFERCQRIALNYRDDHLLESVFLEQAQIAADRKAHSHFYNLSQRLPASLRLLSLQSAVLLDEGNTSGALAHLQQALDLPEANENPANLARLYAALGRAYEMQDDLEAAYDYLTRAITIFEQQSAPYTLSRAQANLGAVLTRMQVWREASLLLRQAEATQQRLSDRVGLAATRHNLLLLRRHVSIDRDNKSGKI